MSSLLLVLDSTFYNAIGISLVALGVLITIRSLGYPDLTPDGSFTVGACVFARLIDDEAGELLATLAALTAGALCGAATVALNEMLRIGKLLSSVIVMVLSVSLAPYILGRATIGLLASSTFINRLSEIDGDISRKLMPELGFVLHPATVAVCGVTVVLMFFAVRTFLGTYIGVAIRYLGSSLKSEPILGSSIAGFKFAALILGNLLVAGGGLIEAQRRGGADQGMGLGIVLTGISALIIGESLVRTVRRHEILSRGAAVFSALIGSLSYCLIVQVALAIGSSSVDVRILTAVLLIVLLGITHRTASRKHELF